MDGLLAVTGADRLSVPPKAVGASSSFRADSREKLFTRVHSGLHLIGLGGDITGNGGPAGRLARSEPTSPKTFPASTR